MAFPKLAELSFSHAGPVVQRLRAKLADAPGPGCQARSLRNDSSPHHSFMSMRGAASCFGAFGGHALGGSGHALHAQFPHVLQVCTVMCSFHEALNFKTSTCVADPGSANV